MIRILPLDFGETKFCLYEDARLLAECHYDKRSGEIFRIVSHSPDARPLYAALIKSVLSALEYAGNTESFCRDESLFPLLKALRFRVNDGKAVVCLKGYFDVPCEGAKQS